MEEEFVKNPEGEFYLGAFHEAIFLIAAAAAAPALSLSLSPKSSDSHRVLLPVFSEGRRSKYVTLSFE